MGGVKEEKWVVVGGAKLAEIQAREAKNKKKKGGEPVQEAPAVKSDGKPAAKSLELTDTYAFLMKDQTSAKKKKEHVEEIIPVAPSNKHQKSVPKKGTPNQTPKEKSGKVPVAKVCADINAAELKNLGEALRKQYPDRGDVVLGRIAERIEELLANAQVDWNKYEVTTNLMEKRVFPLQFMPDPVVSALSGIVKAAPAKQLKDFVMYLIRILCASAQEKKANQPPEKMYLGSRMILQVAIRECPSVVRNWNEVHEAACQGLPIKAPLVPTLLWIALQLTNVEPATGLKLWLGGLLPAVTASNPGPAGDMALRYLILIVRELTRGKGHVAAQIPPKEFCTLFEMKNGMRGNTQGPKQVGSAQYYAATLTPAFESIEACSVLAGPVSGREYLPALMDYLAVDSAANAGARAHAARLVALAVMQDKEALRMFRDGYPKKPAQSAVVLEAVSDRCQAKRQALSADFMDALTYFNSYNSDPKRKATPELARLQAVCERLGRQGKGSGVCNKMLMAVVYLLAMVALMLFATEVVQVPEEQWNPTVRMVVGEVKVVVAKARPFAEDLVRHATVASAALVEAAKPVIQQVQAQTQDLLTMVKEKIQQQMQ